jgi:ATP-dependent DNA helicase RecG
VKSDLYEESKKISFEELCQRMLIAKGREESVRPLNVGVLFFCREPEKYLDRSWIELVIHHDTEGRNFTEKYFKGPLHQQLRAILEYIKTNVIQERTLKIDGRAEAEKYLNYPFQALEEALSNAVYHKSYEVGKPIEVQLWDDKIEILSFPGPVPPVDAQILKQNQRIIARDYRNRRIGDFLKELRLTEGRGTGFPVIYRALELNESPKPVFETDNQSTYFLTTIFAKPAPIEETRTSILPLKPINARLLMERILFEKSPEMTSEKIEKVKQILNRIDDKMLLILDILDREGSQKKKKIFSHLGLTTQSKNVNNYLIPLIKEGLIQPTFKDNRNSPLQTYFITELGKSILQVENNV